jgi:hypothetical protein
MTSTEVNNSNNRLVFESVISSVSNSHPAFDIKIPDNFSQFSPDGQQLLIAFMLSSYESIPVMEADENGADFPSEHVGATVNLLLDQSDTGFELAIEADNALLESPFKKNIAIGIYNALLEIDNSYNAKVS